MPRKKPLPKAVPTAPPTILIFAQQTDKAAGWERARSLKETLLAQGREVKWVNKVTSTLADLELVAKHRIVKTPAVLVLQGNKVTFRSCEIPAVTTLRRFLDND